MFVLAISLGAAEVALRHQPFVTLDYPEATLRPEGRLSLLYHHERQAIADSPFAEFGECDVTLSRHVKLLFLGDSWMQSTAGIPTGFATALLEQSASGTCYEVINGGAVSFSPSVMLVKGRKLIAEYQPDFIVVYVDETDLMDESVRYKETTLRGADGTIERVVPNVVDLMTVYERPVLAQQPSYILRLLEQIYYENVLTPRLTTAVYGSEESGGSYERIMGPRLLGDSRKSLGPEIAYFKASFREMLATFILLAGRDRILIARHPHFLHLANAGRTPRYDNSLSELLTEETAAAKVLYYDAGENLKAIYGADAAAYMTWPADPFSHLTAAGYRKFGRALGQYVAPRINELR